MISFIFWYLPTLTYYVVLPPPFLSSVAFSPHGATAPSGPELPHFQGFTITLTHNTLGRLLWTSDQPEAETST